jgi:magnesium chelatase family protein
MSLAIVYSRAKLGIEAPLVTVEVHLSNGLPALSIVGLPEAAVKESKDRVRSAIINSYLEFPARRITVNLAPADLPKEGGRYDLAIALGILAASGQIPLESLQETEFLGELALSGELRGVNAALPASLAACDAQRALIISRNNAAEAAMGSQTRVFAADSLLQVCAHLHGREFLHQQIPTKPVALEGGLDIADVKGQLHAKRALEICASGGHNLLLYGPPGTGKTMLASRLAGLLPVLTEREMLDVAAIYSVAAADNQLALGQRPFRSPHHTSSAAALVGGGSNPKPGEISLAHSGVLFLDELPEFQRKVLEVLREPLENGEVRISRARAQACYPAKFQLIAAMNPCPCGYHGSDNSRCRCKSH